MKISRRMSVAYAITMVLLISLNLAASITSSTPSQQKEESLAQNTIMSLPPGKNNMTFTSDITMNLTTGTYINFTSGIIMNFTSGITITFQPFPGQPTPGTIQPCWIGQMVGPVAPPGLCTWWEILDAQGNPTGYEFHVDNNPAQNQFHVDQVVPGAYVIPGGGVIQAELKIYEIYPCTHYVATHPPGWTPPLCSWWEILYPILWKGIEFHVDGSGGGEFHIDQVNGTMFPLPLPVYEVVAERKIETIKPCQYFLTAPELVPDPCSWWEILYPTQFKGFEFHVDAQYANGTFHIDSVTPGNITFPIVVPEVTAEKKINTIKPCVYLKYVSPSGYIPQPCDWWEIIYPNSLKGYEFHIDYANDTYIHVDDVRPNIIAGITEYQIIVERKITSISPCDWLKVIDPKGWHPDICSWWKIVSPAEWSGVIFHVDGKTDPNVDGYCKFHFDYLTTPLPPAPVPPPWNVTAVPVDPPLYWKKGFMDYAPSGMPDFDERQMLTYNWSQGNTWTHCSPTAVANSLWWLDSEFERGNIPPPNASDSFPLVSSYATMPPFWDDHAPRNVPPLIEHLAYLMDTDGRRTATAHMGTIVTDMEAGLAQYLQWTGVNPNGDINGDGEVNVTDYNLAVAANNSIPGAPNWNLAADIYPVTSGWPNRGTADNHVNQSDINLVTANIGKKGMFYERTTPAFPEFSLIESEVEKSEDVVLALGFWINNAGTLERYNYTDLYPNTGRNGHSVTVAGVNSTTLKIAISDPAFDAYELGLTPEGRVPVPHVHPAPEPPYLTHDNASLVSQDVYNVVYLPPTPPSFPGGWAIVNYAGMLPPVFTVIEYAVITSPAGIHDVAVTNVTNSKFGCSLGMPTVGLNLTARVNVTVANQGDWPETFNVTAYANSTIIDSQSVTLANGTSRVVSFIWNTTYLRFIKSNYTISGAADIAPADANTTNNNMTDGMVLVTLIGDVNADRKVRIDDVLAVASRFGTNRGGPPANGYYYDSNCDITDDDKIRIDDVLAAAQHFGLGPW